MLYAKLGTALALLVAEPCAALFGACKLGDAQIVGAGPRRGATWPGAVAGSAAGAGSRTATVKHGTLIDMLVGSTRGTMAGGGRLSASQVQGGVYYRFAGPLLINANP